MLEMYKINASGSAIRLALLLSTVLIAMLFPSENARADVKRIFSVGIVPQFDTRQTYSIWVPIFKELQQRTGYQFELSGSPSIPEFEKQLSAGRFDFAYMNPYHMQVKHNKQRYVPLAREVASGLQGILMVKKGGVKSISELEGKTIAFPAPNALGASLLMRADLNDKFKLSYHTIYVKSHSSVYLNVLLGLAAAGGGVQKTLEQQPQHIQDGLEVIYRTESFSPHPFAAHPRVPEKIQREVQQALLELAKTPQGKALLAEIPIKQLGIATLEDYQPISSLGLDRFYIQE